MQKPGAQTPVLHLALGLLLFLVFEFLPYVPTLSLKIGGAQFATGTPLAFVSRKIAEIAPALGLTPGGVDAVSRSIVLQASLLCVVLLVFLTARRMTGHAIAAGRISWSLVLWTVAGVLLAILGPSLTGAVFSGQFQLQNMLAPDCNSIPLRATDTRSVLVFILVLLGPIFVTPLNEEILYRGYLSQVLTPRLGLWGAALTTSALFAMFHFQFGPMLIVFFLAGLLLYFARMTFGGVVAPIVMHCCANAAIVYYALLAC